MAVISRGFGRRARESDPKLPPGQYLTEDFPVLSAGPTPRIDTDQWAFRIVTEKNLATTWTWADLMALPIETIDTDIHCVTRWSKLGTTWRGVSLDTLFKDIDTDYQFAMAHSYGGYTTNIPLADLLGGKSWVAFEFDGKPLEPAHGGPARLLVPHLYFWKSAKWVNGITLQKRDDPGFWEQNGYNLHGDPWTEERYW
ncbi:sulfite oxidase-like oxidoreductase [Herbiconiux sp. L3-i23]|uniref:sulfite oxidase-like oxidoreductase n=1 Tax=Herbiconiux sp. L3-i23 TaxID=2905871 RepID=UPI0020521D18|nr:sulfite oxidase-like oxidoreductase [Herbiconiux sp. L3-i23]BDI23139.1 molybdopterin-binding protein [Herbiconiux sp. L3-i23]